MKRPSEFLAELIYDFVTLPSERRNRREAAAIFRQRELNYRAARAIVFAVSVTAAWGLSSLIYLLNTSTLVAGTTLALVTIFTIGLRYMMYLSWLAVGLKIAHAYLNDCEK